MSGRRDFVVGGRGWCSLFFFFFNDTATTEIYTLSLHDALPISRSSFIIELTTEFHLINPTLDFRSEEHTSESSHITISYAVFCLKKKKKTQDETVRADGRRDSKRYSVACTAR